MSVFIEGKTLNEWIEEQKKKDGVLLVHRGTIRNGYSKSVYTGAIVTNAGKDVCYEDADITVRIKGTEYRLTGSRVERHDGRWFVNGKERTDIPVQSVKESKKANDDLQEEVSEQLNKVFSNFNFGSINMSGRVNETVIHGDGAMITERRGGRHVTMNCGGTVNIHRGGNTYTIKGDSIEKRDGTWYADGKPVDWNDIGGSYEERDVVRIEINGNVSSLATTSGDVVVRGHVSNLRTGSGDVQCDTASNVSTGSGDVHCKHITGICSTGSGDIYR